MDAINTPGAIPDEEQGWQAIIKWKLKEPSVEECRREMEECLGDNLPTGQTHVHVFYYRVDVIHINTYSYLSIHIELAWQQRRCMNIYIVWLETKRSPVGSTHSCDHNLMRWVMLSTTNIMELPCP